MSVSEFAVYASSDDMSKLVVDGLEGSRSVDIEIFHDTPMVVVAGLGNSSPEDAERYGRALIEAARAARGQR